VCLALGVSLGLCSWWLGRRGPARQAREHHAPSNQLADAGASP
jgi:hypothetical protein